ncbi:hypothetical protein JXA85_08135 [Candidatus Woesearchaeota archaeon]|nr:hypothetical protein [Candidatus Woesearchaeota archaeon]
MKKKAQGMSVNVIIIAALALLVLVILAVVFLGRMDIFGRQSNSCTSQGGKCMSSGCEEGYSVIPLKCSNEGDVCCTATGAVT